MFAARVAPTSKLSPIRIIEKPIVFKMSTRSRSVHGAQGSPSRYSCKRKRVAERQNFRAPQNRLPRDLVWRNPLLRNLSVTSAKKPPPEKEKAAQAACRSAATT